MKYKYSEIDPALNRTLYMYSEYKGYKFLEAYKKNRKKNILFLLKKVKKISKQDAFILTMIKIINNEVNKISETINLLKYCFNEIKNKKLIRKNKSLLSENIILLDSLFENSFSNKDLKILDIDKLIKTFEVNKVLPLLKNDYTNPKTKFTSLQTLYHIKFAFILITIFLKNTKQYKYFNTLLKLNDLLSYKLKYSNFVSSYIFICILVLELEIFLRLERKLLPV